MIRDFRNQLWPAIHLLFFAAQLAFFAPLISYAQGGAPDLRGKQLFDAKCSPCHTIGGGRKVGPDLQDITKLRSNSWLFSFISNPDRMFAQNDPAAVQLLNEYKIKMPNMSLPADDVNAVISYLGTQGGSAPQAARATTTTAGQAGPGEPEKGEQYFSGRLAFQNGGPPCMACHSVPGIMYLGGGNLGPDLTTAYQKMGEGITSLLVNVPFPTMKPIFDRHPLTSTEAGDVAAFLRKISSEQPQNYSMRVITVSVLAFILFLLIMMLIWRNRLKSVRRTMVEQAKKEGDRR